ncbi:MAG: PAS domain S-box protein, partial [Anaerolineae bacterium]|nr:PAS domain S-box protein [Anaerolineae bacterium]
MNVSGLKILIIDDSEDQYLMIRYYLSRTSHVFHLIDHAADYQTALQIIARREYDLYLVDYYLGHRDGLELIHEAVLQGCTAPMLLMTGASDSRIAISAIRGGAIDYLDKNELTPSVLDRAIRYATDRAEIINALRESEERYRDLFENSAELIQSVNETGRFEYVNRAWQAALGYSAEEVASLSLLDILHPSQHDHCLVLLHEILSGNAPRHIETIFVTRDGRELIVEGNITLKLTAGKAPATRGIFRDVTQRRQLEIAEREQRVLAEALRDTAAALNSTLDFNEILDRILTNVELVVPHESANIMLIETGVTRFARIRDYTDHRFEEAMMNLRFIVAETPSFRQVYETRQPLIIPDVKQYPDWVDAPESDWIGSYAAVPIQSANNVIGFLNLNSTAPNFFTPALVDRLLAFSNQIALAVENAHLYEQARELAATQERQRLARDLHDTINQTLFATSITAEALTRIGDDVPP